VGDKRPQDSTLRVGKPGCIQSPAVPLGTVPGWSHPGLDHSGLRTGQAAWMGWEAAGRLQCWLLTPRWLSLSLPDHLGHQPHEAFCLCAGPQGPAPG
jgi:hypothetical protein